MNGLVQMSYCAKDYLKDMPHRARMKCPPKKHTDARDAKYIKVDSGW